MKLLRHARVLLLSVPLALGSIALAAAPASAYTEPPPIHTVFAPPGVVTLSVPDPGNPSTCPYLNINGSAFGTNDGVTVTLRTINPATWAPNYDYNVTLGWGTDWAGNLIHYSTFPGNWTSGFEFWQVVVSENGHFDTYSNIVECAP